MQVLAKPCMSHQSYPGTESIDQTNVAINKSNCLLSSQVYKSHCVPFCAMLYDFVKMSLLHCSSLIKKDKASKQIGRHNFLKTNFLTF